jgi:hypothetical protein
MIFQKILGISSGIVHVEKHQERYRWLLYSIIDD